MPVVSHRLSTVENAHHNVVLDEGPVVEEGTHASLVAAEGCVPGGTSDGAGVKVSPSRPEPSLVEALRFFLRPYRGRIVGLVVLQAWAAVATAIGVGAVAPLISEVLGTGGPQGQGGAMAIIGALIDALPFSHRFVSVVVFFLVATAVAEASTYAAALLAAWLRSVANRDWSSKAFRKVAHADYQYFLDTKRGDVVHLIMVAAYNTQTLFEILHVTAVGLQMVAVFGLLLSISLELALGTALAGALAYVVLGRVTSGVVVRLGEVQRRSSARQVAVADEAIRGIRFLKVYDTVGLWREAFRRATAAYTRAAMTQQAVQFAPSTVVNVGFIGAIGLGGWVAWQRWGPEALVYVPTLAVFARAFQQLLGLMSPTAAGLMGMVSALPYAHALKQALEADTAPMPDGQKLFQRLKHQIAFDRVSYAHNDREHTLADLSFTIERNEVTAVVGPSGAGKSTIVDLLLRLYDVQQGTISVDDTDLKELDVTSWRQAIGYVSQEPFLFNSTIAENIALGKPGAAREEIVQAAKMAGAHEFVVEREGAYDAVVADRGLKLSAGQRQRIVLARAILRNPQLMLLDEPTSALDTHSEAVILGALRRLRGRCTIVVIAHRLSTFRDADKIVVLNEGRIAGVGTHETLLAHNGLYASLYARQAAEAGVPA